MSNLKAGELADDGTKEAKQNQTKLSNFQLYIRKERDDWKIINPYFYKYVFTSDDKHVCLGEKDAQKFKCIKVDKNLKDITRVEFIECFENKCLVNGKGYAYQNEIIADVKGKNFLSKAQTYEDHCTIKLISNQEKCLGNIYIKIKQKDVERAYVDIVSYDEYLEIETLTLIFGLWYAITSYQEYRISSFKYITDVQRNSLENLKY